MDNGGKLDTLRGMGHPGVPLPLPPLPRFPPDKTTQCQIQGPVYNVKLSQLLPWSHACVSSVRNKCAAVNHYPRIIHPTPYLHVGGEIGDAGVVYRNVPNHQRRPPNLPVLDYHVGHVPVDLVRNRTRCFTRSLLE